MNHNEKEEAVPKCSECDMSYYSEDKGIWLPQCNCQKEYESLVDID